MSLEQALHLAELGWPVFPAHLTSASGEHVALEDATPEMKLKKVPIGELVEHGFREATVNPRRVGLWWRVRPDALIGVAMPQGTVALDVDDPELFARAGLELPDGPGQQTFRGGYHRFFRSDGRRIRQTVKEIPGADTRVADRGYVLAWEPDSFPPLDELPLAPEWLYATDEDRDEEAQPRRSRKQEDVLKIKMGERDNKLTSIAGSLRKTGLGKDAIYAALKAMVASGQVEQSREDPISDKDLRRISGSIGGRQSDAVDKASRPKPTRHNAETIRSTEYPPLEYFVDEIWPEGVGLIGGSPKVGKSFLVMQLAMEIASGGSVLGRDVLKPVPVLYYALEDGPRRAKHRMSVLSGTRDLDLSWLEFRFDAPMIGDGLEEDVDAFIGDNADMGGCVVLVDVLAMVQPESRRRDSAYNQDYSTLRPFLEIVKHHSMQGRPATIAFLTHVRKMGSDDPYATIQGTTGLTGSADWAWVVKRPRLDPKGTIQINGRDIEHEPFIEAVFNGAWTEIQTQRRTGSPQRDRILDELLTGGDATPPQLVERLNASLLPGETPFTENGVTEKLGSMLLGLYVKRTGVYLRGRGGGNVWHAVTDGEHADDVAEVRSAAATAVRGRDHRGPEVRRVHRDSETPHAGASTRARAGRGGRTRAMEPPQAPYPPHSGLESMERMEGREGDLSRPPAPARSRARPRAPAHTRSVSTEIKQNGATEGFR